MVKLNAGVPFLLSVTALPSLTTAWSAECFKQSGGKCITWDGVWALRDTYCNKYWKLPGIAWIGKDSANGNTAQFTHTTNFGSQQECWDSFDNIAHECHGHYNGGSWTWGGNTAVLDFCIDIEGS